MIKHKKSIMIIVLVMLLIPTLKVNYYNGESMDVRSYSVLGIIIQDVKDGTVGTGL